MYVWFYLLLATAFFVHFKDYLFFMRDLTYRNIVWNPDEDNLIDFDEMDEYLKKNYNKLDQILFKTLFIFFSPIFFIYIFIYIKNKF